MTPIVAATMPTSATVATAISGRRLRMRFIKDGSSLGLVAGGVPPDCVGLAEARAHLSNVIGRCFVGLVRRSSCWPRTVSAKRTLQTAGPKWINCVSALPPAQAPCCARGWRPGAAARPRPGPSPCTSRRGVTPSWAPTHAVGGQVARPVCMRVGDGRSTSGSTDLYRRSDRFSGRGCVSGDLGSR